LLKKFNQSISEGILYTDQYELVMAQLYFKHGLHETKVQFDHFFRNYPDYGTHKAGYCINAGLEWLIDWMQNSFFTNKEIEILKNQKTANGKNIFQDDFLNWLGKNGNFTGLTLKAIPEGRAVHPNIPLTVVQGPVAMSQILETALLNQLNYQILIATKACRVKEMSRGGLLIDFGARRGQDRGTNAGIRGALIGGADFSSNVGISHILGFPAKGTHAHSMVQLFLTLGMSEYDAFEAFTELYPENSILLVDTINTLESGIPNAIKVFEKMKKKGRKPAAIRLDSGDLAYLSIQAARMLNAAGFNDVGIVLSNELDEMNIWQIITQITEEAPKNGIDADSLISRLTYGVGTKLITSAGAPSLGGVYKLVAVENKGDWKPAIKISESNEKIPNPGRKGVWRIYNNRNKANADFLTLYNENPAEEEKIILHHPYDQSKSRTIIKDQISGIENLLADVLIDGKLVYEFPPIEKLREKRNEDLSKLDTGVKRLINPHLYHVSISKKLWDLKQDLITEAKI
jgi:nicotinate phosphoribosyltransferase